MFSFKLQSSGLSRHVCKEEVWALKTQGESETSPLVAPGHRGKLSVLDIVLHIAVICVSTQNLIMEYIESSLDLNAVWIVINRFSWSQTDYKFYTHLKKIKANEMHPTTATGDLFSLPLNTLSTIPSMNTWDYWLFISTIICNSQNWYTFNVNIC